MVHRPRAELPIQVREAIAAELLLARELSVQTEVAFKVRVYLATEQGMTTQQIADELGCSQSVVSKWRLQGAALLAERQEQQGS